MSPTSASMDTGWEHSPTATVTRSEHTPTRDSGGVELSEIVDASIKWAFLLIQEPAERPVTWYADAIDASATTSAPEYVPQITWQSQLRSAAHAHEVLAILRQFGLTSLADRLHYLRRIARDDPEEPRIELDSLRELALFLMGERWLPEPQIGVSPDGLAHAEWLLPGDSLAPQGKGALVMEFLCSGLIRFAAVSSPPAEGERLRVSGTLSKADTLQALQPFTALLSYH